MAQTSREALLAKLPIRRDQLTFKEQCVAIRAEWAGLVTRDYEIEGDRRYAVFVKRKYE